MVNQHRLIFLHIYVYTIIDIYIYIFIYIHLYIHTHSILVSPTNSVILKCKFVNMINKNLRLALEWGVP